MSSVRAFHEKTILMSQGSLSLSHFCSRHSFIAIEIANEVYRIGLINTIHDVMSVELYFSGDFNDSLIIKSVIKLRQS